MSVSVVIADNHQLFRQGLAMLLSSKCGMEIRGQADNGRTAIELAEKMLPDILITEITLPGLNGIDVARSVHNHLPDIRIVGLSSDMREHFVIDMLKAGASAYLTKHCSIEELIMAIESVCSGNTYLSPMITNGVLKRLFDQSDGVVEPDGSVLSEREREVLQLVAEGNSSKEIASLLSVSQNTVIRHRQNITDKLNINGVAELTRYAIREGLINP